MALVDYSSSSEEADHDEPRQPPAKRRKSSPTNAGGVRPHSRSTPNAPGSELPPLPPAFHDLYASTVRQSVVDDPTLHQGRKRQIPHVVGNWPSHLYVEWHPTRSQHDMLVQLVVSIGKQLDSQVKLHDFLTSDLGATQPLHISLSRPIALSTANKDRFLERATSAIRSCGTGEFAVSPHGISWYKSADSDRIFLILQVASSKSPSEKGNASNTELMTLLRVCNSTVASFNQPILYQNNKDELAEQAFHISIGWTFGLSIDDSALRALGRFDEKSFQSMKSWKIKVSGVKAKIGNVVSHIPLTSDGAIHSSKRSSASLFGL